MSRKKIREEHSSRGYFSQFRIKWNKCGAIVLCARPGNIIAHFPVSAIFQNFLGKKMKLSRCQKYLCRVSGARETSFATENFRKRLLLCPENKPQVMIHCVHYLFFIWGKNGISFLVLQNEMDGRVGAQKSSSWKVFPAQFSGVLCSKRRDNILGGENREGTWRMALIRQFVWHNYKTES